MHSKYSVNIMKSLQRYINTEKIYFFKDDLLISEINNDKTVIDYIKTNNLILEPPRNKTRNVSVLIIHKIHSIIKVYWLNTINGETRNFKPIKSVD